MTIVLNVVRRADEDRCRRHGEMSAVVVSNVQRSGERQRVLLHEAKGEESLHSFHPLELRLTTLEGSVV